MRALAAFAVVAVALGALTAAAAPGSADAAQQGATPQKPTALHKRGNPPQPFGPPKSATPPKPAAPPKSAAPQRLGAVQPRAPNGAAQRASAQSSPAPSTRGVRPLARLPSHGSSAAAGRFTSRSLSPGAAAGLSGNSMGRRAPAMAAIGGPARYDGNKGAVIGGAISSRR
jgi:hypothetical protein